MLAGRRMQAMLAWRCLMPQRPPLQSSMLLWPGPFWGQPTGAISLLRPLGLMRGMMGALGVRRPAVGRGVVPALRLSKWQRLLALDASAVHSGLAKPFCLHLHCPSIGPLLPHPPPLVSAHMNVAFCYCTYSTTQPAGVPFCPTVVIRCTLLMQPPC